MATPIDIREESGVRTLHFGSDWIQGAMRIARPWQLELDYTREMMTSLILRDPAHYPRKVLLIGLGAASLTKFLYRYRPEARLTVVEIDSGVVAAARHFFKLPDDPQRIQIVVDDGAEYMLACRQKWDLVLVDGFDADARAGGLDTLPFYQAVRASLSEQGLMVVNLLGRSRGFKDSVERIRTAFDGRALAFPSSDSGNAIAFATGGEPVSLSLGELKASARALKDETGLNLLPVLSRLEQAQTCAGGELVL